ncbi:hemolysin BL lytic component L2, partial [Bacillus cereus]
MKSRVIKGFLVTSFLTGGALPICTFATPIALAEIQQENVGFSLSLGQLGNQSKYIQFYVDEALKR